MTWPIPTLPTNFANATSQFDAHPQAHNALADAINELAARATPTAWTAVTFLNGWVNYGGSDAPMQYRKIGDVVELRGNIKSGTIGQVAFQLPVGFRPPYLLNLATVSNSLFGLTVINTAGQVQPYAGSNVWFSICHSFSTVA